MKVGACTNYVFAGFMVALCSEGSVLDKDEKEIIQKKMLEKMGNAESKLDLTKAAKLTEMVGHASVAMGKKVAYVNYRVINEEGKDLDRLLAKAMGQEGTLVTEPPPPRPAVREIRKAVLLNNPDA